MVFSPNVPSGFDLPCDDQDDLLDNISLLNTYFNEDHVPLAGIITLTTQTNPCAVLSVGHTLSTGNTVTINGVLGMTELNGNTYTITVFSSDVFTLNGVDATAFETYLSGGYFNSGNLLSGYHRKLSFTAPLASGPATAAYSALYTKFANEFITQLPIAEMLFQNGVGSSFEKQISGLTVVETVNGKGFKTPWGITINVGQITLNGTPTAITYPVPYTQFAISTIAYPYLLALAQVAVDNTSLTVFTGVAFVQSQPGTVDVPIFYISVGR